MPSFALQVGLSLQRPAPIVLPLLLLPNRDRGDKAARVAAPGPHLLVHPETDAVAAAVVPLRVVAVVKAREVPQVVATIAASFEQTVEPPTTV